MAYHYDDIRDFSQLLDREYKNYRFQPLSKFFFDMCSMGQRLVLNPKITSEQLNKFSKNSKFVMFRTSSMNSRYDNFFILEELLPEYLFGRIHDPKFQYDNVTSDHSRIYLYYVDIQKGVTITVTDYGFYSSSDLVYDKPLTLRKLPMFNYLYIFKQSAGVYYDNVIKYYPQAFRLIKIMEKKELIELINKDNKMLQYVFLKYCVDYCTDEKKITQCCYVIAEHFPQLFLIPLNSKSSLYGVLYSNKQDEEIIIRNMPQRYFTKKMIKAILSKKPHLVNQIPVNPTLLIKCIKQTQYKAYRYLNMNDPEYFSPKFHLKAIKKDIENMSYVPSSMYDLVQFYTDFNDVLINHLLKKNKKIRKVLEHGTEYITKDLYDKILDIDIQHYRYLDPNYVNYERHLKRLPCIMKLIFQSTLPQEKKEEIYKMVTDYSNKYIGRRNKFVIQTVNVREIEENIGNYNTNNHGTIPEDYTDVIERTYLCNYIDKFRTDYKTVQFTRLETEALREAAKIYSFTGNLLVTITNIIEKYAYVNDMLDNSFVRSDSASLKYGIHKNKKYTDIKDIIESIITAPRTHSPLNKYDLKLYIVPWVDIKYEFRVFVHNKKITAISPQHIKTCCYEDRMMLKIANIIVDNYETDIKDKFDFDICYDIGITQDYKPYFIEANPFGKKYSSGSAIFHWIRDEDILYGKLDKIYIRYAVN
uniref:ATP-grasp domain-containing protein n=1 Tax=viral metagenome TaxID=1070528 RepID=A0A6C0EAT9_9ZZZZ